MNESINQIAQVSNGQFALKESRNEMETTSAEKKSNWNKMWNLDGFKKPRREAEKWILSLEQGHMFWASHIPCLLNSPIKNKELCWLFLHKPLQVLTAGPSSVLSVKQQHKH